MTRFDQNSIAWADANSSQGLFHRFRGQLSVALGGKRGGGIRGGGSPLDLEMTLIPPGAANWPYHSLSTQWELVVVMSGHGLARTPEGEFEIDPGDCFVHPPGEPHQIGNLGMEDLIFYVLANPTPMEIIESPGSGQWFIQMQQQAIEMTGFNHHGREQRRALPAPRPPARPTRFDA